MWDLHRPGLNLHALCWKHGVITPRPLGSPQNFYLAMQPLEEGSGKNLLGVTLIAVLTTHSTLTSTLHFRLVSDIKPFWNWFTSPIFL